jgi:hypothetical protein
MGRFYKHDDMHDATPVVAHIWAGEEATIPGEIQTEIRCKKTRSTLAIEALDIFDLEDEYAVAAFKSLIRLCQVVGRDEIVVECLDNVATDENDRSINDCFNSIQSDITRTCRTMNLFPPRVSLEKRGQHFDLRIYPTFH